MIFSRSILCIAILLGAIGCAVIPAEVSQNALHDMPLAELIRDAGRFRGETVVVGGYVVEVTNLEDQSRIIAVQAPLGIAQEPRAKDLSQGRIVIRSQGFIDPEVYKKERKITVAGNRHGQFADRAGPVPLSLSSYRSEPHPFVARGKSGAVRSLLGPLDAALPLLSVRLAPSILVVNGKYVRAMSSHRTSICS